MSEIDTPEERLARWTSRDAAIGLAARCEQLQAGLDARDREIADLRERLAHLTNANGQLQAEKAKLVAMIERGGESTWRRAYLAVRRRVGRFLRG